jgi:hypothetical protein
MNDFLGFLRRHFVAVLVLCIVLLAVATSLAM